MPGKADYAHVKGNPGRDPPGVLLAQTFSFW